MGDDWAALIRLILACAHAGSPLPAPYVERIARAFQASLDDDLPLETAMGLPPRWRTQFMLQDRQLWALALQAAAGGKSLRACIAHLESELLRYRSSGFDTDLRRDRVRAGWDGMLFRLLRSTRGKVPSQSALRDWLGG